MKILFALAISAASLFAQGAFAPYPIQQPLGNGGQILIGSCLYTYQTGTTTPLATYSNAGLTVANANPIVLNSSGRAPAIFLSPVSYKFVLGNRFANACPATPGTVIWSQDPVFDYGQQANAALVIFEALLASSAGSSHIGFLQSGTGAVAETVQAKLRQTVNVLDYGALCDGATDDRTKIQAAIDAVGNGTLIFPARACAVSSPGIFLYPANTGITVRGFSSIPSGDYVAGAGGGFVATASSPPTTILTNMADFAHLENLYFDCRSSASAHGLVNAASTWGVLSNVVTSHCSGDGMQINNAGTPATTLTAGTIIGATQFHVAAVTNNRITFGSDFCNFVDVDYGNAAFEELHYASTAGTILTLSAAAIAHSSGAPIQCHGNANDMMVFNYSSFNNGGWGFAILPNTDNNAIQWFGGSSSANTLGGELWFGSNHVHVGGDYQGDSGPAIQLGDTVHLAGTHSSYFGPIGDAEENTGSGGVNAVVSVCDDKSQVFFNDATRLQIKIGAASCATYSTPGSNTMGIGTSGDANNSAVFFFKRQGGLVKVTPGADNFSTMEFQKADGTVLSHLSPSNIANTVGYESIGDSATDLTPQLAATSKTNINQKTIIGYNNAGTPHGYIQSLTFGSPADPLLINPAGGTVTIGSSSSTTNLIPPTSCAGLATGTFWNNAGTPDFCP